MWFGFRNLLRLRRRQRDLNNSRWENIPERHEQNDLIKVKVTWVDDADGITVRGPKGAFKVRLSAIDAPEHNQDGAEAAKAELSKLVDERHVYLEAYGIDRYGRMLATVYVMNRSELMNVNERLVMMGHAWVAENYCSHLSDNRREQLIRLQRWARWKRMGIWRSENPIPPWVWRQQESS